MKKIIFVLVFFICKTGFGQGLNLDPELAETIPQKANSDSLSFTQLPAKVDMTKYVPHIIDQGGYDTCVPVSTAYYMRTILEAIGKNITDRDKIDELRYSPSYLYNEILPDSVRNDCEGGTYFEDALEVLKTKGVLRFADQDYSDLCKPNKDLAVPESSRIADYVRLFSLIDDNYKVLSTKKALSENTPVVVGLQTTINIDELDVLTWLWHKIISFLGFEDPEFALWKPNDNDLQGGHAVCLVGYDNDKFGKGAFKAVNSRGYYWGDDGFFWILYSDYERLAKQAFQAYLLEDNETGFAFSGEVSYLTNQYGLPTDKYSQENEAKIELNDSNSLADSLVAFRLLDSLADNTVFRYSVKTDTRVFLYVLDENKIERVTNLIFPNYMDNISEDLGKNTKIILPLNSNEIWKLGGTKGQEYVLFLFSKKPLDIYSYQVKLNENQNLSLSEKLVNVFGNELIPMSQINYDGRDPRKMKFLVNKDYEGSLVPLILTYQHI